MTTTTLAERVEAGAAVLDANRPGWAESIDTSTLDLVNVWSCVLGQVYGSYMEGTDVLGIDRWGEESAALGFRLPDPEDTDDEPWPWDALTEAWREYLADRLDREGVPA